MRKGKKETTFSKASIYVEDLDGGLIIFENVCSFFSFCSMTLGNGTFLSKLTKKPIPDEAPQMQ